MHPIVCDAANQFDRQTHAYAEFRLFSRLAAEHEHVASALVRLHRADAASLGDTSTACQITIVTPEGATVDVTASAHHPYAAIDCAVAAIGDALGLRAHDRRQPERESA